MPVLRRLLLVPAVGLFVLGAPVLALENPGPAPPETTSTPLESPGEPAGPGAGAETDRPANLVGVKWSGDPDAEFTVEVRRRGAAADQWEEVGALEGDDTAPDEGSRDQRSSGRRGRHQHVSEPLWVGDAEDVRVTVASGAVSDVSIESVVSETRRAPRGSAGAWGAVVGDLPESQGYAFALVLGAGALGAFALGWAPWRSRRQVALLGVLALVVLTACVPPSPNPIAAPGQPTMTMRSQWGPDLGWNPSPDCAPGPEIPEGGLNFVVVHHTVNSNTYGPTESRAMVRAIWQYHVGTLRYCDIAYNFLVDRYGQIFEGRRGGITNAVIGAHTGGFNTQSSGMAFIGNFTSEQPPAAAWNAMVDLIAWKLSVHLIDPASGFFAVSRGGGSRYPAGEVAAFPNRIVGHRDLWATACPGDAFYPRLPALRAAVQPKVGWDPNAPPTTTTTTTAPTTTTTT